MPKKTQKRRSGRRGTVRAPRRRPSKLTAGRIVQAVVSFAPVTAEALEAAGQNGGILSQNGIVRGALPTVTKAYGFYNTNSKKFDTTGALVGYPMLLVGYGARRLVNRLWR